MKALIFLFLFAVSIPSFPQLKKAEKLFEKEKYEKSLEALSKVKITRDNKSEITAWKMKCHYHLYMQNKSLASFERSFTLFTQLYKTDKTSIDYYINSGIHENMKTYAQNFVAKPDHKKAKVYAAHLATYFQDTTDFYYTYYPKKVKSESDLSVKEVKKDDKTKKKVSRASILDFSKNYVGIKYKWGGEDTSGFDCSGFVLFVMRNFGYNFNHGAKDQSELGTLVSKEKVQAGDLVFFGKNYSTGRNKIDHVAMVYTFTKDHMTVIHCTSKGVIIQELKEGDYWSKKILFYKNIID